MKTKILVRSFLCLLAALMMLSCVACKKEDEDGGTANTVPPISGDLYSNLPKTDFGGAEILIASRPGYVACWEYDDYVGEVLQDLEFERVVAIEQAYNCAISIFEDENIETIVGNNHTGGVADFDLFMPHPTTGITSLMDSGALGNLRSYSILDLDSPWWSQKQVKEYTVNGRLLLGVNDSTITGQGFSALVYNQNLYDSYNVGIDVHECVMNGTWTAEQLKNILVATESDDENEATKTYGLIINKPSTVRWLYGFGGTILKKTEDSTFVCGLDTNNIVNVCEKFVEVMYSGDYLLVGDAHNAIYAASNMFTTFSGGRGLFIQFDIGTMYNLLRDLSFKESYAPLPLATEGKTSDYASFCGAGFWAIPSNCKNPEYSAIILEYAAIHGYDKLKPAFFESVINGRLSENPEDAAMLELLHQSKVFDMGFTVDSTGGIATHMLRDTIMPVKSATGAVFWLRTNQSQLDALATTANTIGT